MTRTTEPAATSGHLQAVCENATVALFVMDDQQHCVYMNASAELLTGYRLAEVQGQALHNFVHHTHPDGRPYPLADCPIDRAAPQNLQEQGEEVLVHKDGHFYPVAFTASPIRRDGEVLGTVIEVRELTREKQREAENLAMRQLGKLMLEELDLARMVQKVTDTSTQLTGAQFGAFFYNTIDEAGGVFTLYALSGAFKDVFATFPHPRATPLFAPTFRGDGTVRMDDATKDARYGQWGPHPGLPPGHPPVLRSYLAVPVKSDTGEVLGGLFFGHARAGVFTADHEGVVESIAAQAAVGMSRLRLINALEREAREKERLFRDAEAANRMKDQFLATISHELRTPLTSILGWSEMLVAGRLAPDMVQRAVQTIDRNARAQAQIIEDLLDISRIISGKLHLQVRAFDVVEPVDAAVDAVRPAALARDVQLALDADPDVGRIDGDPDRLQQVVWNLVTNAVKFTDRGGEVRVGVYRRPGHIEIRVHDTGRGIAAAFIPHLFERFTQGDSSSTREHGGLGLGLSIVRQLVEMHGGRVDAASDGVGHGATFVVQLPFSIAADRPIDSVPDSAETRNHASLPSPDVLTACRVLLVEDDADSRAMFESLLMAHGAEVQACASARQALAQASEFAPTLVISDIGMPGMDGYDFIRAFREMEAASGRTTTPAIALTAYARTEDKRRALAEGFQMHVAKPVQPASLVGIAQALCAGVGMPILRS